MMPVLLLATLLATTDAQLGWSPVRLDLTITLWPEQSEIEVDASLRLRLRAARSNGPTIVVNGAHANMRLERVDAPDGATATIDRTSGARADVHFAEPRSQGDEIDVHVVARNRLAKSFQFQVGAPIALASWTEAWYPHAASSDDNQTLRVPGTTTFSLPKGWHAITNGKLTDAWQDDDRASETWECETAVARSFAAGPFHVAKIEQNGRTIGAYLVAASVASAQLEALQLARALDAMEQRFGPYPFASYAIVEVPTALVEWGASSEQGFVMANSLSFTSASGGLPLFAHEMAHGWWGNLVTGSGPGSILLSESLAQYGAVVAIETLEGAPAASEFLRFSRDGYVLNQCARGYFDIVRRHQDVPLSQLASGGVHHTLADAKGHWVYHMLRARVGDELFFATLRKITDDYREQPLTLAALRAMFVRAAPAEAQLETFFAQWLDRVGAPIVDVRWSQADAEHVELDLAQVGDVYDLAIEVAIDDAQGTRVHTIALHDRNTRVTLSATTPLTGVRLDPNHRLLIWQPEYGPRP